MWNLLHRHKIGAARRFLTWADSTKSRNLILRSLVSKSTAAPPVEEAKRDKSVRKAPAFDFATMGEFELTSFLKVSERSKIDVSPKLSDILRTLQRCSRYEKPDSLAAAAYALRHSDGSHAGAFGLVEVLAIRIRSCRDTFNTIQICKIMSGVRFMSSDHVHVRAYIDATCLAIKRSEDSLNPRFFGVVLYSLKSMNCDSPEVRKLLKVISGKLEIYVEPLDGQCIGNMLYGLRGMSSVVRFSSVIVTCCSLGFNHC